MKKFWIGFRAIVSIVFLVITILFHLMYALTFTICIFSYRVGKLVTTEWAVETIKMEYANKLNRWNNFVMTGRLTY